MSVRFWNGSNGNWNTAADWTPNGASVMGDLDAIQTGWPPITNQIIPLQTIWLDWNQSSQVGLSLQSSNLMDGTWLFLNADYGLATAQPTPVGL